MLTVTDSGDTARAYNTKDGYAIRRALEEGYQIAIISGGKGGSLEHRMRRLGIRYIFAGIDEKLPVLLRFCQTHAINPHHALFMGDDLNDYEVMKKVGLPCCPADACAEIMAISHYVSPMKGGEGCVRDVIEKVMKLQGKWMNKFSISS
jgi:3-deoxy-D-manno-octulosonate 8-phosphate phosphatase (KDO 8-P phosphatase)